MKLLVTGGCGFLGSNIAADAFRYWFRCMRKARVT